MALALALGAPLAVAGCYYLAALAAMARFRRQPPTAAPSGDGCPSVSLLKPAAGAGPEFATLLRSHAAQDHPDFEILVGIREADRAARAAVRDVGREFPQIPIKAIDCPDPDPGCNGKVQFLLRLAEQARYDVWVVNDADIGVPDRYLRALCADLGRPGVGLVTCLYRAEPGRSMAASLQALWIGTEFATQVLLARELQGLRFALGATLAFRRQTLQEVGGFESLLGVVGDDYHLGARVAASGKQVEIASVAVTTHLPRDESWASVWRRQLRWLRTIRAQRPLGHGGLAASFGTVWAGLALLLEPSALWPGAAAVLALRLLTAAFAARLAGGSASRSRWLLLPAADCAMFLAWACSFFGRGVEWAGRRFRLGPGGRILA